MIYILCSVDIRCIPLWYFKQEPRLPRALQRERDWSSTTSSSTLDSNARFLCMVWYKMHLEIARCDFLCHFSVYLLGYYDNGVSWKCQLQTSLKWILQGVLSLWDFITSFLYSVQWQSVTRCICEKYAKNRPFLHCINVNAIANI